jgi:hypothetical protein
VVHVATWLSTSREKRGIDESQDPLVLRYPRWVAASVFAGSTTVPSRYLKS